MCNKQLIHQRRRLKLTLKWPRWGVADHGDGSMGFGWGGFGEGTVREEEGQNCLLNADVVLQALLVTQAAGIAWDLSHIVYMDLLGALEQGCWGVTGVRHMVRRGKGRGWLRLCSSGSRLECVDFCLVIVVFNSKPLNAACRRLHFSGSENLQITLPLFVLLAPVIKSHWLLCLAGL